MASRVFSRRPAPAATVVSDDRPLYEQVRYHGLLTVAVMGASVMQILDTTIANVAIPHMQSSLGATRETVNWVLTSYIIASAVAMPITGWLADRVGRRALFLGSVIGFIIASMACGAAQKLRQKRKEEFVTQAIETVLREAKKLGLTKAELLALLAAKADEEGLQ